ncbi:MAG: outer membrane beta-barrel protein [Flavobacteriales bacterium]|nr:outer membrane beta-barrel protein [Flavobacteriales bacterium]
MRLLLAGAMIAGCSMVMAQESRFSAGLELAMPMGDWADFTGFGFGVSLGYEIPVGDNLGVLAQAGYINFSGKDFEIDMGPLGTTTIEGASLGAIPIQVGAKYYFSDNQEGAYLGVLTGLHIMSSSAEGAESNTNFGVAPMFGFFVTENIDLALRYQMLFDKNEVTDESTTSSYLGLRAAYMFGGR